MGIYLKTIVYHIIVLILVLFILFPFQAYGELEEEIPYISDDGLIFSEGVKGNCLKGADESQTNDLFKWISAHANTLGINNQPQPILNDQCGTVSLWINHTSPYFWPKNIFDTLIDKNRIRIDIGPFQNADEPYGESWKWLGGRISASFIDEEGETTVLSSRIILEGKWYHIALTWDSQYARLYVNGFEVDVKKNPAVPDLNEPSNFYLNRTFSGDLDEIMIFNKPLSYNKILKLTQKEDLSKEKSLVFHLPLDGNLKYLARRHEIPFPSRVKITFPKDRQGYFPLGRKLPIKIIIPATAGLTDEYTAVFSLIDNNNQEIFTSKKSIFVSADKNVIIEESIMPEKCGIYWIKGLLLNKSGEPIKEKEFPFAVTVNLPHPSVIDDSSPLGGQPLIDNHMPEGRFLGMKWDRFWKWDVCWQNIEPKPGLFTWNALDRYVNEAKNAGNEILFTIHGVPDWATSAPADQKIYQLLKDKRGNDVELWRVGRGRRSYPPVDIKLWERFIRKLVNRYKDKIQYWEIWNEPNSLYFLSNGNKAEDYTLLLKTAYKAIHEEDPRAKVLGMDGCPGFLEWTENVLKAGGGPYFDILSLHNYNYDSPISWARKRLIERTRDVVYKYTKRDVPIWNTEFGFGQAPRINNRPMSESEFFQKYGKLTTEMGELGTSEHRAACWEIQAHLLDLASGAQKVFLHSGYAPSKLYKMQNRFPTEKGVAYAAMAKVVSSMKIARRIPLNNPDAAGIMVQDKNGHNTAVLFSDTAVNASFITAKDKLFKGMDYLGNPMEWQANDGILSIKLGMEPIYLFNIKPDLKETALIQLNAD